MSRKDNRDYLVLTIALVAILVAIVIIHRNRVGGGKDDSPWVGKRDALSLRENASDADSNSPWNESPWKADSTRVTGRRWSSALDVDPERVAEEHLATDQRPDTGTTFVDGFDESQNSRSSLTVENGLTRDAVIKLVNDGNCLANFYVRGGTSFTFSGIEDGDYVLLYGTGFGWSKRRFTRGRRAAKFDQPLKIETIINIGPGLLPSTEYTKLSLTLHKVVGGNATTEDISLSEFDRY